MITVAEKHLYGNGKSQQLTPEKEGSKEKELSAKEKEKEKDKEPKESPTEGSTDIWRAKISLVGICVFKDTSK